MSLSTQDKAHYVTIIDELLTKSDPDTVSVRRIRKGLEARIGKDLTEYKALVAELIDSRFDKVFPDAAETVSDNDTAAASAPPPAQKVKAEPASRAVKPEPLSDSDLESTPPASQKKPTKPKREPKGEPSTSKSTPTSKPTPTSDAAFAARLQAEENRLGARPSRTTTTTNSSATKKRTKPTPSAPAAKKHKKKPPKSASKIKTSDAENSDSKPPASSDNDDDGESSMSATATAAANPNNPFNKPMHLSPALSQLLDGEMQLSRPQTVKRIWAYIKARDLQDPEDRRQIRCDEALRAVFKTERVHMFTMNKILSSNLHPVEE